MHDHIKRFQIQGNIASDSDFIRLREQYEKMVLDDMRDSGYVPVLDIGPHWSTKYVTDGNNEHYEFIITMYGVRVGKKKAWELDGMSAEGLFYRKSIPKDK